MDEKKVILERKWKVMETTEDFLHLATDWWNQFQNIEKVELCIKKVEGKVTAPYHSPTFLGVSFLCAWGYRKSSILPSPI